MFASTRLKDPVLVRKIDVSVVVSAAFIIDHALNKGVSFSFLSRLLYELRERGFKMGLCKRFTKQPDGFFSEDVNALIGHWSTADLMRVNGDEESPIEVTEEGYKYFREILVEELEREPAQLLNLANVVLSLIAEQR
ncbi:MAG: hypothetical protein A2831_01375 [Candidatus Yanofskybacteria bacterium RIFCSPHIGHO2_01_FULL_44_17]|uniref:Uncharacterized protein n=1 Tax=Candidatus Yanofskybacteria bacterium RIFCSPHIGHO2_01_FULL_44_17 TaxID=1802668 RepID=A0A1F8EX73_9BACT|nr:MAG: hypothetical protein A2831_01375 [Candidatus Yanofskybacteria bacterium RIFCSPHIGHO2_01_FULL_44_17]